MFIFCVHTVFFVFLLFPLFLFSQALEACSHHVCVYRIKINEPVLGEGLNFLLSVCSRTKQLLKRVKKKMYKIYCRTHFKETLKRISCQQHMLFFFSFSLLMFFSPTTLDSKCVIWSVNWSVFYKGRLWFSQRDGLPGNSVQFTLLFMSYSGSTCCKYLGVCNNLGFVILHSSTLGGWLLASKTGKN